MEYILLRAFKQSIAGMDAKETTQERTMPLDPLKSERNEAGTNVSEIREHQSAKRRKSKAYIPRSRKGTEKRNEAGTRSSKMRIGQCFVHR